MCLQSFCTNHLHLSVTRFLITFFSFVFFFNDTATTEIYTLSLHDALPICAAAARYVGVPCDRVGRLFGRRLHEDRKSTRLNSSHMSISYAVFCLKKKKKKTRTTKAKNNTKITPHDCFQPRYL